MVRDDERLIFLLAIHAYWLTCPGRQVELPVRSLTISVLIHPVDPPSEFVSDHPHATLAVSKDDGEFFGRGVAHEDGVEFWRRSSVLFVRLLPDHLAPAVVRQSLRLFGIDRR